MNMTPAAKSVKTIEGQAKRSALEEMFALHLQAVDIPFEREVKFHPDRQWRFDFTVAGKIAIEVEGGTFGKSRHTTGIGFEKDASKYAEALCLGWRVLRVTGSQVRDGRAIQWLERLMT